MAYMMGIDLGTSSLKVIIMDETGNIKAQSAKNYQFDSPYNGYAEQKTEVWWDACCQCIKEALYRLDISACEVKGVSFSGQMHGAVFLDKNLQVIRPAILHNDARSGIQVRKMNDILGRKVVENLILNPIYTGFLLPSLIWVRDNEPDNYEKVRHVFLPKDYLKMMLTGEVVSDYSDASATLAFDIENVCWSEEILNRLDIPIEIFPKCFSTDHVVGKVTKKAARETGLSERTIVVNGGGDQVMQAIGNGATEPGLATVNIGSSGQVCFQSNRPIRNPNLNTNTFCGYQRGKWITMGATMSAGLSLKWFSRLFVEADYNELDEEVKEVGPGSGGIIFLPYLNGERTPHVNPNLSGMFMGVNGNTRRPQMARAVMEGVSYSLMQCIEVCGELGLKVTELIASGGGARSAPWLQLQADIYHIPLKVSTMEEQAGLGAAITSGVGAGIYGSIDEGCRQVVKYQDKTYIPNGENHKVYEEYYQLYKDTYKASKDVIQRITELGRRQQQGGKL